MTLFASNIRRDYVPHKFSVRSEIQYPEPEPVYDEEGYDDEEYEEPAVIVKPKRAKRLPGVKLLKKLHRERQRQKEKEEGEKNIDRDLKKIAARLNKTKLK